MTTLTRSRSASDTPDELLGILVAGIHKRRCWCAGHVGRKFEGERVATVAAEAPSRGLGWATSRSLIDLLLVVARGSTSRVMSIGSWDVELLSWGGSKWRWKREWLREAELGSWQSASWSGMEGLDDLLLDALS